MWPWEHAIVAYLAYSLWSHLSYRDSPSGVETLAVVVASVVPDAIDKPLAWEYGVFESGYALGHSLFFAVPLAIAVGALARRWNRPRAGVAFAVGYLLHLPADLLDESVRGDGYLPELMFWPVADTASAGEPPGFGMRFQALFEGYRAELLSGDPSPYLLIHLGIAVVALLVWLADGAPVARDIVRGGRRLLLGASGDESTER